MPERWGLSSVMWRGKQCLRRDDDGGEQATVGEAGKKDVGVKTKYVAKAAVEVGGSTK